MPPKKRKPGTNISRRNRAPWKPEKGENVSFLGIPIPERLGFAIVVIIAMGLLVAAIYWPEIVHHFHW